MKYLFILAGVVCLSFMLQPACAPQTEQQTEAVTEEVPSTEADVTALNAVIDQWEQAINTMDMDRCLAILDDGAIWMPPNEPSVVGKEAVLAWMQQPRFDQFVFKNDFTSEELVVFGDWAFDRGTYKTTITPKAGGEAVQDVGKYLDILKRQSDGTWKYARAIWNSDNPQPE